MHALMYTQADGTLLVHSDHRQYQSAHPMLLSFTEMIQRLDPIHVYRVRPVTLWQAASLAIGAREVLDFLRAHTGHPLPYPLQRMIVQEMGKWGRLVLHQGGRHRIVVRGDKQVLKEISQHADVRKLATQIEPEGLTFHSRHRADVKRLLALIGFPVIDRGGYQAAPHVPLTLSAETHLRDYQKCAVEAFLDTNREQSGVIVLPCGAGKTVVGLGIVARLQLHTLVLTPNESSALQWRHELLQRTSVTESEVRLYNPSTPLAPITITTYQRVTAKTRAGDRRHLSALTSHPWGLVVYDEVHMLPAPLFRLAADLQGARRLGLTATLVREDGADTDVFSLIGPKCFEVPWKQLEAQGFLAAVQCIEIRVPLDTDTAALYQAASAKEKHRIAAQNPAKLALVKRLLEQHAGESVMIIGHYLDSLHQVATALNCPVMTGQTPQDERERLLEQFRSREIRCLVLSRIANMAIDLPCASVAIQLSGLFGSRQEEAQRLGRLLRPETEAGVFYSLVSAATIEERMAQHRQLYLLEQGYSYDVKSAENWCEDLTLSTERVMGP